MKNNTLHSVLLGVLAVSLVVSVFCCLRLVGATRDARKLGLQQRQIQFEQARFQALVNECMEYSKKNPGLDPLLESFHLKESKAGAKPGAK